MSSFQADPGYPLGDAGLVHPNLQSIPQPCKQVTPDDCRGIIVPHADA